MSSVAEVSGFAIESDALKELAGAVSRLKRGDFSVKLPAEKYDGNVAEIFKEFNAFIDDMRALFAEVSRVADEAAKGNLDVKVSVAAYGDYAKLVENVNKLIDSIVIPIRGCEELRCWRFYAESQSRYKNGRRICRVC